jgi:hypothetical protein
MLISPTHRVIRRHMRREPVKPVPFRPLELSVRKSKHRC